MRELIKIHLALNIYLHFVQDILSHLLSVEIEMDDKKIILSKCDILVALM